MVSGASFWEISIKARQKRPDFTVAAEAVLDWCRNESIEIITSSPHTMIAAGRLPLHHKDPFDRLIIAEAQARSAAIMTTDHVFARYDVDLVPLT